MSKPTTNITELQEEVNKLRQKLKNSHRVPKSDIEAVKRRLNNARLLSN